MTKIDFQVLRTAESSAQDWLRLWADRYDSGSSDFDKRKYAELIEKQGSFVAGDLVAMGQWKDVGSESPGKWKENVASVAFRIWIEAADEPPRCPKQDELQTFLEEWKEREYEDVYSNGKHVRKHFGLSRATTLLHFLSGGRYPIFDSRVRTAVKALSGLSVAGDEVAWYINRFLGYYDELAAACGTPNDLRRLDKALFSYGAFRDSAEGKFLFNRPNAPPGGDTI
jgi:hypothetical protein